MRLAPVVLSTALLAACGPAATGLENGFETEGEGDLTSGRAAVGVLDSADGALYGWACDQDTPTRATQIHAYFDGPAGAANALGLNNIWTGTASEAAVQTICGGGANHRFNFTAAEAAARGVTPGMHPVWTYAISSGAGEGNRTLNTVPKYFPVPATSIAATYNPTRLTKAIAKVGSATPGKYAYAPSIMRGPDGRFHLWACNDDAVHLGDSIAYVSSSDGVHWSAPVTALYMPSALQPDTVHTCDPSVVRFRPPGSATTFYYLYYTMSGGNGVARAIVPQGPFAHYMGGDPNVASNWVVNPPVRPRLLQTPTVSCAGVRGCYGVGEPSVVLRGSTLWMFYTVADGPPAGGTPGLYLTRSTNGVTWTAPVQTSLGPHSSDVKWDPASKQFVMIGIRREYSADAEYVTRTSKDGVTWTEVRSGVLAPYRASEPGFSGDERGFMTGGKTLLGISAPYDLTGPLACVDGQCELFVLPVAVSWK